MPSGASEFGGPVFDARIDPTVDAAQSAFDYAHMDKAIEGHLFGSKGWAAETYSHVFEGIPNQTAVSLMGLARERDFIVQAQTRQWEYPFPGAELGALPSVSRAPDTSPILGGVSHLTHHAHHVESKRRTRARFG